MKVLLLGYYGKANFGDDVLLKVTHSLVRELLPGADISVCCDRYIDDYLPTLLGENLCILKPGDSEHFDLIIHGGGGTFFDFSVQATCQLCVNKSISSLGFENYVAIDGFIRRLLGKQRFSGGRRIGWGVGVGTYTPSSKKLRHHIPTILDFDMFSVRDSESLKNLEYFKMSERAVLGSDLAFLSSFWMPSSLLHKSHQSGTRPRLGVILRDWHYGHNANYLESFVEMLPQLQNTYELSLFIFDKRVDKDLLDVAKSYDTHVWNPPKTSFDDFCSLLAQQDVLVSSRAHGAICGAVLGIPSVLIEIEPKLKTIHEMLPQSTVLHPPDALSLEALLLRLMLCWGVKNPYSWTR